MFAHIDYFAGILFILMLFTLLLLNKLPTPEGFEHFLSALNSKGGNILILSVFTYIFSIQTIRWFYRLLEMVAEHQLNEANAIATLGAQFLTTTAFGMFAGALISTLTGQKPEPPKP